MFEQPAVKRNSNKIRGSIWYKTAFRMGGYKISNHATRKDGYLLKGCSMKSIYLDMEPDGIFSRSPRIGC